MSEAEIEKGIIEGRFIRQGNRSANDLCHQSYAKKSRSD